MYITTVHNAGIHVFSVNQLKSKSYPCACVHAVRILRLYFLKEHTTEALSKACRMQHDKYVHVHDSELDINN